MSKGIFYLETLFLTNHCHSPGNLREKSVGNGFVCRTSQFQVPFISQVRVQIPHGHNDDEICDKNDEKYVVLGGVVVVIVVIVVVANWP